MTALLPPVKQPSDLQAERQLLLCFQAIQKAKEEARATIAAMKLEQDTLERYIEQGKRLLADGGKT